VICAPVRQGRKVLGLIHLYSTDAQRVPDPEDLEFTLAVADTVAVALTNLQHREELAEDLTQVRIENVQLRERLGVQSEIIGNGPGMRLVAEETARAAASKATLLIRGESGVGKELVARAVHYSSPRRKNVFVCLNCAALSEDLLASELFGHERGAFTGATDRKIGKFEAGHLGTLMLDEIGEMSPGIQAKFLRVLEGHPFERVGGSKPVKVDVRVIAATNRDLRKMVQEGAFREDLYYRLRVVEITIPPLRERREDIPVLAHHFLEDANKRMGRSIKGFTNAVMDRLVAHQWSGNVRELANEIERIVALAGDADTITVDMLSEHVRGRPALDDASAGGEEAVELSDMNLAVDELKRKLIRQALEEVGSKSKASEKLGIPRQSLQKMMKRLGMKDAGAE